MISSAAITGAIIAEMLTEGQQADLDWVVRSLGVRERLDALNIALVLLHRFRESNAPFPADALPYRTIDTWDQAIANLTGLCGDIDAALKKARENE